MLQGRAAALHRRRSSGKAEQGGAQGFRRRQALPLRTATAGASHCQAQAWGAHEPRTEEAHSLLVAGAVTCEANLRPLTPSI